MKVSVIIVHYAVPQELFVCLRALFVDKASVFEVIVVDNDEQSTIQNDLLKKFPQVRFIKSEKNVGYGGGNNLGAKKARGEYLFFLNPDTIVQKGVMAQLAQFLDTEKEAGIVAPVLLDKNGKTYLLQGTKELTPFRAICSLSFIQKLFPNNTIAQKYWNKEVNKQQPYEADVVPGSAFLIRKNLFEKLGGFDEHYFLFFEEHDLCNRVKASGWKCVMVPQAKVIHFWGESTQKSDKNIKKIFQKSRFYYFRKFYGLPTALLTEGVLRFSKETIILSIILSVALFLRFYRLDTLMLFIGDFAWFYISARDWFISGHMPLVGIASSHPWIHQGAFWTYLLSIALWVGNFNPLSGGYLAAVIGVLTVIVLYYCTEKMFGIKTALFTSAFFATSPLVVISSRIPYHTAPIPLFVMLYIYSLYQWMRGNHYYFPLALFSLVVLYNFELATAVLASLLLLVFAYGIYKKTDWIKQLQRKKILFLSLLSLLVPLLPMLIYDFSHGFPQTLLFIAWLGYRVLVIFGYPPLHPEIPSGTYTEMLLFMSRSATLFYYAPSMFFAITLGVLSIGSVIWQGVKSKTSASVLITSSIGIPALVIFLGKTPSDAYLPMLFSQLAIVVGIFFSLLTHIMKKNSWIVYALFLVLVSTNVLTLINHNFFSSPSATIREKEEVAKEIISTVKGRAYTLLGKGPGSEFVSFTMPYEYLTWWLGYGPSEDAKTTILIDENTKRIQIEKR